MVAPRMAISSETSALTFTGNNSTVTAYAVTFPFSGSTEIVVTHVTAAGVRTTLAVTTGYTLSGTPSAGTAQLVTVAAIPVTDTLLVERFTSAVQSLDSDSPAGSYPTSIETQLDRSTRAIQDNKRVISRNFARSLRVPDGEAAAELPAAAARKGEIPYFNATTGALETKTPNEILALSGGAPDGVGIPAGGTTGQALVKNSGTDYDAAWSALAPTAAQVVTAAEAMTTDQEFATRAAIDAEENRAAHAQLGRWRESLNTSTAPVIGLCGDSMIDQAQGSLRTIIENHLGLSGIAFNPAVASLSLIHI
jgi:hypothetical protein